MANNIRSAVRTINKGTRLTDDMNARLQVLSDPQIFQEVVLKNENPFSPLSVFGGGLNQLFGSSQPLKEGVQNQAPGIELIVRGTDLNFIAIKEIYQEPEYSLIVDNSNLKDSVYGGEQFELTLNRPYESREVLTDFEKRYNYIVVSTQYSSGLGQTLTLIVNVDPTTQVTDLRRLLAQGNMVSSIGNTMPEASRDSNTLKRGAEKADTIYNAMKVQRYKTMRTGHAMSDRLYAYTVQPADGGQATPWYIRLPELIVKGALKKWEQSLIHSRSGFKVGVNGPEVFHHIAGASDYSEVSLYAGIREQLEYVKIKYTASTKFSHEKKLKVLENMWSSMTNAGVTGGPGRRVGIIAMGPAAKRWVTDALLYGGLAKTAGYVQFTKEVSARNGITAGLSLESFYFVDGAEAVVYDMASNMVDEMNTPQARFVYDGVQSPAWSNKVYIIPLDDGKRRARLFTKESTDETTGRPIRRGFVIGRHKGFTGADSSFSADRISGLTGEQYEAEMRRAMGTDVYNISSPVDADEYHVMTDHSIMLDIDGMAELTIFQQK